MHAASCLLSVLAPLQTPAEDALLSAIPPDTFAAVHITNMREAMARRDTSRWIRFGLDPGWVDVAQVILRMAGDDLPKDEVTQWRNVVLEALAESPQSVVFVAGEFFANEPTSGLLARGGDKTSSLLRSFLETDAAPATLEGGHDVLLSEEGRGELFYVNGDTSLVLTSPTLAEARSVARECAEALKRTGEPQGPFAIEEVANERANGEPISLEFAADLRQLWPMLATIQEPRDPLLRWAYDALVEVEWMHASMHVGDEEEATWRVVFPFGPETLLGGIVRFGGRADASLASIVPASASSTTILAYDVPGFVTWALDELAGVDAETHALAADALTGASELIGVDLRSDVLASLTGQFVHFRSDASTTTMRSGARLTSRATMIATVDDVDVWIDLVEVLLDATGLAARANSDSFDVGDDSIEVWRVPGEREVELAIAVGAGRVVVSTDVRGFDAHLAVVRGDESAPPLSADEAVAAALGELNGSLIGIQPTASYGDAIEGAVGGLDLFFAQRGRRRSQDELRPLASAIGVVADALRRDFRGRSTTCVRVEDNMVRVIARAR